MNTYGSKAVKCLLMLHLFVALTLFIVAIRGGDLKMDTKTFIGAYSKKQTDMLFWAAVLLIIASVVIALCLFYQVYNMITYGVNATSYSRVSVGGY